MRAVKKISDLFLITLILGTVACGQSQQTVLLPFSHVGLVQNQAPVEGAFYETGSLSVYSAASGVYFMLGESGRILAWEQTDLDEIGADLLSQWPEQGLWILATLSQSAPSLCSTDPTACEIPDSLIGIGTQLVWIKPISIKNL